MESTGADGGGSDVAPTEIDSSASSGDDTSGTATTEPDVDVRPATWWQERLALASAGFTATAEPAQAGLTASSATAHAPDDAEEDSLLAIWNAPLPLLLPVAPAAPALPAAPAVEQDAEVPRRAIARSWHFTEDRLEGKWRRARREAITQGLPVHFVDDLASDC